MREMENNLNKTKVSYLVCNYIKNGFMHFRPVGYWNAGSNPYKNSCCAWEILNEESKHVPTHK